jgi:hypothetical protein
MDPVGRIDILYVAILVVEVSSFIRCKSRRNFPKL